MVATVYFFVVAMVGRGVEAFGRTPETGLLWVLAGLYVLGAGVMVMRYRWMPWVYLACGVAYGAMAAVHGGWWG